MRGKVEYSCEYKLQSDKSLILPGPSVSLETAVESGGGCVTGESSFLGISGARQPGQHRNVTMGQ